MNQNTMNILEFGAVIDEIKKYAMSEQARLKLEQLKPVIDMDVINAWMRETTQACAMLDINSSIPLSSMEGMDEIMIKAEKSMVLTPQELTSCQNFLDSVKRLRSYMSKTENSLPELASYAWSMFELSELRDEIAKSIINGQVDDHASHELARIRRQLLIQEERIKQKLGDILRSSTYGSILQDPVISTRNGRYVVPVKRQYHKSFPGRVLDTSSTGSTVFMEPNSIAGLQDEINILQMEEANEVYRILSYLSTRLGEYSREILINMQAMAHYDFVFAKAKYSRSRDMKPVRLNNEGRIIIKQARHPLLGSSAVPLDFQIGADYRALIITGPNTGGKTVALKTIALLTLMVQCGLHVPVETDSEFAVFNDILADIGDGQSIEQSLSTFSAHLKNILSIIELAGPHTLVVMDEMGAGTDPAEGKGFAIAVLEEVFSKGATIAATTHFGEIKEFAAHTPGFENGSMAFDVESLRPLYRLQIGTAGESNAFLIALRLGMDRHIIERAHQISYGQHKNYDLESAQSVFSLRDEEEIKVHQEEQQQSQQNQQVKARYERRKKYVPKDLKVGDCVYISTMQRTGIVCEEENGRGDVVVLVMDKKYVVNSKRLTLKVDREDLYPENYDMDIVLESKDTRKKRKIMSKRHVEGLRVEKPKEDIERGD